MQSLLDISGIVYSCVVLKSTDCKCNPTCLYNKQSFYSILTEVS